MSMSPTLEYPEYYSDNSTKNSENKSSFGRLIFYGWMKILSLIIASLGLIGNSAVLWLLILSLIIASLGLIGNSAVLWLLGFRTRRTPFSVYILNLAGADALFLCCSFLNHINGLLGYNFYYSTRKILLFLTSMSYTAGLSFLAAISTERCLSALFPIWYGNRRSKHTSAEICGVLWALAWMLELTSDVFRNDIRSYSFTIFTIQSAWFFLLTCVMCMSSLTLLLRVQCNSRPRRLPRLYLLVLLRVLVFLLCGLPWGIEDFLEIWFNIYLVPYWPYDLLSCVNSSVNPFIYFFVGRLGNKRREPLRVVLQRALGDEQELGGGTTNTPHISSQETTF